MLHYCQQKQNEYTHIYTNTKVPSWWLNLSSRHYSALWAQYGLWVILFFRLASGLCLKLISVYILAYAWLILQGSSTQPSLSREGETAVSASRHRRIFVPLLFLCFRQRRFFLPYVDAAISTTCCCMLHSLKNPSIPHSSSLCVSLDFFFFSSLFLVRASLCLSAMWLLDQSGNTGCN